MKAAERFSMSKYANADDREAAINSAIDIAAKKRDYAADFLGKEMLSLTYQQEIDELVKLLPPDPDPDYAEIERKHLGDPDKKTGIYASTSAYTGGSGETLTYDTLRAAIKKIEALPIKGEWIVVDPQGHMYKGKYEAMFRFIASRHPLLQLPFFDYKGP